MARFLTIGSILVTLPILCGCPQSAPGPRYSTLAGVVVASSADLGELTMAPTPGEADARIVCIVTDDAEVYINDQFARLDQIQIGDAVELVGYRDQRHPVDRFVVSIAEVHRPAPPTPAPQIEPPAASQPEG